MKIEIGTRVETTLGSGIVTGHEECFGTYRHAVKLDKPENWSLHDSTSADPLFWPKEISINA